MPKLARLAAALAATAAPALSLAQEAGGREATAPGAGYGWLWLVAAALVVAALFGVLVARGPGERPSPPARRP
ncbi:MAG TPA: hypothetical protein VF841_16420 [Anaeromyxobacter sp.]